MGPKLGEGSLPRGHLHHVPSLCHQCYFCGLQRAGRAYRGRHPEVPRERGSSEVEHETRVHPTSRASKFFFKKDDALDNEITKETTFGATIWKDIERRQLEETKKGKMEEEMSVMQAQIQELKEMQIDTNNAIADIKSILLKK